MNEVFSFSALCTVARYQDVGFRHYLTQHLAHLRVRSADNSSHIAVIIAHVLLAPRGNLLADPLIQRTSVDDAVLELAAGRGRGFYQNKDTFFLLFADLDERFYAVRSKIRIDSCKILMESGVGFASHLHVAEVADCIRLRSRTDIASFDIADDNETLFLAVGNGLLIRCHSRNAELLIHGNLRFYSRNQIVCCVDNRFIELPNGLCSSFECLSVLGKCLFLYVLRHIVQHRI